MNPRAAVGDTLWQRWTALAEQAPDQEAVIHYAGGLATRRWTRGGLRCRALEYRSMLRARGVRAGDVCATILRHDAEFYPLYMGVIALGAIPAVLAYPNPRLHPDKFREGLRGMARTSGLDWALLHSDLAETVAPLLCGSGSTVRGIICPFDEPLGPCEEPDEDGRIADVDAPCLVQHSSGTTGLQKGVALSHRAVLRHIQAYGAAVALSPVDRVVSWLPLYHDMGLIAAFHAPLATGIPSIQLDPFEWITAPALFFEACARERATVSWLPNFAYNVMTARVHDDDLTGVRLDTLRLLVNCSEPVRFESHERFADRFASWGFQAEALGACYAMAETTFAITQTPPGRAARTVELSRSALAHGVAVPPHDASDTHRCVSSGPCIEGCAIEVRDAEGRALPDGHVGTLHVQSDAMFAGYRNDVARTAEVLRERWLDTGDLGFCLNGEYFVIGRSKDLIIVAGKNIAPEDVEDAVSGVAGVTPGRLVAIGMDDAATGTEQVWIIAETQERTTDGQDKLRRDIVRAAMQVDVTVSAVHLVPPRWLTKSSSGKPSRAVNRQRLLDRLAVRSEGTV